MFFRIGGKFRSRTPSFNITPIIDIVFLLIIFFLVVCQFIEAENFPVAVPDGCEFAQGEPERRAQVTTVTVMRMAEGGSSFAVGSEKISAINYSDLVDKLTELIDVRLEDLPPQRRVVTLRIDKGIYFAEAQYALAGIAASSATDIQLATFKDKRVSFE
ncbi:MAG: biopolymer transporter ExbD [Planctomycetota bacterium]|nr:MAG: biopolymer transporter ExbD [Planctomycetota bacterium]